MAWKLLLLVAVAGSLVNSGYLSGKVQKAFNEAMGKYRERDGLFTSERPEIRLERMKAFAKFHEEVIRVNKDKSVPFQAADNFLSILTDAEKKLHMGLKSRNNTDHDGLQSYGSYGGNDKNDNLSREKREGLKVANCRDFSDVLTGVKDQGNCGSCWTFAGAAALEGEIYFVSGVSGVSLSEQEYVDCATQDDGCLGGWMWDCYTYSRDHDRIATTSAYPYKAKDSRDCHAKGKVNVLEENNVKVVANKFVRGDEALLEAATEHIVSVAVKASQDFQMYNSGILVTKDCNKGRPDHAVTLVGYGEKGGRKFWKVRNSWGSDWGDNGHIKMDRDRKNMCGISSDSHYPIVECRDNSCKAPNPDDGDICNEDDDEDDTDGGEEDICFKEVPLSSCVKSRQKALDLCKKAKLSANECVIVKANKRCYLAPDFNSSISKKRVEIGYPCKDEDKDEDGTDDGDTDDEDCDSAAGMVWCSDCNCCKHKHFCHDQAG